MDLRFASVEHRLGRMEHRLDQFDGHFHQLRSDFDGRFEQLRSEFRTSLLAVMSMMVVLVAAMVAAVKL